MARFTSSKNKRRMGEAFQKTFRFTGGEIVNEFLMSTGYLARRTFCRLHNSKKGTKIKTSFG
jgi:DNA-3-methyladenine glycosylase I